jgi:hypothetical protein
LDVSAATTLFVERADAVGHSIPDGEGDAIAEICQRLDGIPLAVELAASRMASMTAAEVRDRLDHRFRLLVGSRRGLERHQTLRHAVQWSYDLLDEAEKTLLERCSVFAGGFDLESACAVTGYEDEFVVLDLLDALVRKSLIIADRPSGRTRYSMLETIRQFAEEHLVTHGEANEARTAHAQFFAAKSEATLGLWDSPRQRAAYDWFVTELPNLRSAFRWAADCGDIQRAAGIVVRGGWFGVLVENFEPVTWAEELVEPLRAVGHRQFASVCAIASLCYMQGRAGDALAYSAAGDAAIRDAVDDVPFDPVELWLGAVYSSIGESDRYVDFYHRQLGRGHDLHQFLRGCVVISLLSAGRDEEALAVAAGMVEAAETTQNPYAISFALMASGMAQSAVDPVGALAALRRGLLIAQESGNRANVSYLAMTLAMALNRIDGENRDPSLTLDNITLAIRNYYDSGNITQMRAALGLLTTFLDRRHDYEPAAVVGGFAAVSPTSAPSIGEFETVLAHLRDELGAQSYAALARQGADMSMVGAVSFAHEQIDRVRRELELQR